MTKKRMIYDHPFDPKSDDPTECKECYDFEDMHESSVKRGGEECNAVIHGGSKLWSKSSVSQRRTPEPELIGG